MTPDDIRNMPGWMLRWNYKGHFKDWNAQWTRGDRLYWRLRFRFRPVIDYYRKVWN